MKFSAEDYREIVEGKLSAKIVDGDGGDMLVIVCDTGNNEMEFRYRINDSPKSKLGMLIKRMKELGFDEFTEDFFDGKVGKFEKITNEFVNADKEIISYDTWLPTEIKEDTGRR